MVTDFQPELRFAKSVKKKGRELMLPA